MTRPPAHAAPRRRLGAIAAGYGLAGAVILGLGFWVAHREPRPPIETEARALVVYDPAPGATVERPVTLLFQTTAPLALEWSGWSAGRLHPHAVVDGVEVMPAAADIEEIGPGRFRWRLAGVEPGAREIQLIWSGPDHAPLDAGASAPIRLKVRE